MSGIYLVLLLSVSVFVVCNGQSDATAAGEVGVELVKLVKTTEVEGRVNAKGVDKREPPTGEVVCQKACEDAGQPFGSVADDGTCICVCQYYDCDVVIPEKRAMTPLPTKAKPILKEPEAPCCSNNKCTQLCTDAGMEGGACNDDGNCICDCKPCFAATWTEVACPDNGSKRSRSLLWS